MDDLRDREVTHLMRRLEHLSPADRGTIEHFSRALMNKFMHDPSVRLRAAAANGGGLGIVDAVRYLFALEDAADRRDTGAEDER
jgi:glutamyl-tRNA reductase